MLFTKFIYKKYLYTSQKSNAKYNNENYSGKRIAARRRDQSLDGAAVVQLFLRSKEGQFSSRRWSLILKRRKNLTGV